MLKEFVLVVTSDNEIFSNCNFFCRAEKQLKYFHRQLSKKKLNSKNRNKARKTLAKEYEKISFRKNDQLHKISKQLINENQVIIAEGLNIKLMLRDKYFSKSISQIGWGELLRQLKYKSEWYGRTFHQIDRFFPSSKTCNCCQFVLDNLPLSTRDWCCPKCHSQNDRDLNAACNIRDKGLKDLGLWNVIPQQKLVEASSLDESMKQEISRE